MAVHRDGDPPGVAGVDQRRHALVNQQAGEMQMPERHVFERVADSGDQVRRRVNVGEERAVVGVGHGDRHPPERLPGKDDLRQIHAVGAGVFGGELAEEVAAQRAEPGDPDAQAGQPDDRVQHAAGHNVESFGEHLCAQRWEAGDAGKNDVAEVEARYQNVVTLYRHWPIHSWWDWIKASTSFSASGYDPTSGCTVSAWTASARDLCRIDRAASRS